MTTTPCQGFVVVVDDEEDARELLRELLEARGYQVATAHDGLEALRIIGSVPRICLMILDLMMPGMDGFEVIERLGEMSPTYPVWISTSAPDRVPPGMPCLPKPLDVDRLLALVEQHCRTEATPA